MEHPFGGEFDLALEGFEHLAVTVPGCVSAYVGADITCSVLASGMAQSAGNLLLVDAGTNGEMVLRAGNRLACCSTAAGPAFEGAGIACGGNAAPGAVDSARWTGEALAFTTIGGLPATHLCGSGLIDAAAALFAAGLIDESGRLTAGGASGKNARYTLAGSGVYISQQDIRQLQLAKAAIRAGMDTLIAECGLGYGQVDGVILCGGFGSYLRPSSAECIGLIPPGFAAKARAIGNAAGNGAGQILQSGPKRDEAAAAVRQMEPVELSAHPMFSRRFVETMAFGEDE
jgi:uncharacterized 2Fe-2S/4Fe-4S cluster protein (DUF4445 family)